MMPQRLPAASLHWSMSLPHRGGWGKRSSVGSCGSLLCGTLVDLRVRAIWSAVGVEGFSRKGEKPHAQFFFVFCTMKNKCE